MNNKNEIYVCNANCPELDSDNSKHCTCTVKNEEDKFNMLNNECPCGNNSKWALKEKLQ
jgi:hypothetical protein